MPILKNRTTIFGQTCVNIVCAGSPEKTKYREQEAKFASKTSSLER